jgi:hypothetical protein
MANLAGGFFLFYLIAPFQGPSAAPVVLLVFVSLTRQISKTRPRSTGVQNTRDKEIHGQSDDSAGQFAEA